MLSFANCVLIPTQDSDRGKSQNSSEAQPKDSQQDQFKNSPQADAENLTSSASERTKMVKNRSNPLGSDLEVHKINEDTFYVKDTSFFDTNVMVSQLKSGDVLIASSHIDTVKNLEMLKWIHSVLKPKKIFALNTHFHADGTGGNEAYQKKGVEIWSSRQTQQLYSKRAASMQPGPAAMLKNKKHKANTLKRKNVDATHFFDQSEQPHWNLNDSEVKVFYPGPAHSEDNLVVFLPEQKILFGGCMVRALEFDIGNTKDANLKTYEASLKKLFKLDPKIIIPGHGTVGGTELLNHSVKMVQEAKTQR